VGVLLILGSAVYLLLTYSLTSQIEESLKQTADDILQASRRDMRAVILPRLQLTGNVYVQVWTAQEDGNPSLISTNLPVVERAFDEHALNADVRTFTETTFEAVHLRVLTVPIIVLPEEEIAGYLQLASPLDSVDRASRTLLLLLTSGGLFGVLAAVGIGYLAARSALRPLEQVTETATQITRADDLSRRIPLESPPTGEVGRLVLAFNETLERLERLFETQRRFLADVSHELRTPLTTIRGNIDLIRRMGAADNVSLDAVASEVERMTRMVRDLLFLAQAETGKLPLAREEVELDTLMLEVFQQAKILANGKVDVKLAREDQARVVGDKDRLQQVFLNLVSNAVEYCDQGDVVTLDLVCEGKWAKLSVQDTGPGIPEEEQSRVFERFYRADRSRSRKGRSGTGLGLSIAHWIVRSHGGHIEVASKLGEGATFSVWLPRVHGSEESQGQLGALEEVDGELGA
jgi:signal transduction histidine kinase